MGGRGSGRRSTYDARDTTEGARPLDIRKLKRSGLLTPGRIFRWQWTLNDQPIANRHGQYLAGFTNQSGSQRTARPSLVACSWCSA